MKLQIVVYYDPLNYPKKADRAEFEVDYQADRSMYLELDDVKTYLQKIESQNLNAKIYIIDRNGVQIQKFAFKEDKVLDLNEYIIVTYNAGETKFYPLPHNDSENISIDNVIKSLENPSNKKLIEDLKTKHQKVGIQELADGFVQTYWL
jgi:hypothetical protein